MYILYIINRKEKEELDARGTDGLMKKIPLMMVVVVMMMVMYPILELVSSFTNVILVHLSLDLILNAN
jgi:hypothetical protein